MDDNSVNTMLDDNSSGMGMKEMLQLCIKHWRWYLGMVAVALSIASFYIKKTEPVYCRSASVMVLDGSQENSALSKILTDFTDMGFAYSDKANVSNVTAAIQSPDVMTEVVSKLGLDVEYTSPGTFYDATLYGKTLPVVLDFHDIEDDETASVTVKILDDGKVEMSGFMIGGAVQKSTPLTCKVGQTVHTPLGIVSVKPTDNYAKAGKPGLTINVRKQTLNAATGKFLSRLKVELADKKSTILNITFEDVSTTRAEDVLNAVIDIYNDVWVKNRSRVSDSTSDFIDERLAIIERELGGVDADIANYKSKNLVPNVEVAYTLAMERADRNSAEQLDLNTRLTVTKYVRDYIVDKANTNQLIPVDLGLDNEKVDEQISKYNAMQLERNRMMANTNSDNPMVADLDKSLDQLRRAIIYALDNMMVSLSTRISHLQNDEQRTNTNISANPTQEQFLLSVQRQQKVKEALYLFLLQKREESELSRSFTANNTQVIKSPTGSNAPIAPRTSVILLAGLVVGLALPTVVIYLFEVCNTTVRSRRDIDGKVSVPLVGEIPQDRHGKHSVSQWRSILGLSQDLGGECRVVVEDGCHDAVNEAFRVLRTNVAFLDDSEPAGNICTVTSLGAFSGKTFISVNLGVSMALMGKRVLVVDGDLRKASLSSLVGSPHQGICNYLDGSCEDTSRLIYAYGKGGGIDILPVGTVPDNPSELLSSPRLRQLLGTLASDYDLIIIDCPPVDTVADTSLIVHEADRTLLVLRAGLLWRSQLPEVEKLCTSGRLGRVALVLNGTSAGDGQGGYHYA